MGTLTEDYVEHLKTVNAQKLFQEEHKAYRSKFQLRVQNGPHPYVDFGNGVKLTHYRKFFNMSEVLKFLVISDEVREQIHRQSTETYGTGDRSKAYFVEQKKLRNKVIYEQFGVSQAKFLKLINGKAFEAFVKPIPKEIREKLCFNAGGLSAPKINKVHQNMDLLMQAVKDNQNNILPIILFFSKNPSELKSTLGKGLWKRICSNSFSKNAKIVDYLTHMREDPWQYETSKTLESIVSLPTTLLKHAYTPTVLKFIQNSMKGKWTKSREVKQVAQEFSDTVRLIETVDGKAPLEMVNWSVRRLKEEHRAYTEKAIARRYNPTKFWWVDEFPISHFCYEGYEIKLLKSEAEIGLEGSMMGHCVGGYGSYSSQGRYLVFSVIKDDARHSTIGINCRIERSERVSVPILPPLKPFSADVIEHTKIEYKILEILNISDVYFNQHYRRYNQELEGDDKARDIPDIILEAIADYRRG
jgi:hypothetical protein